EVSPSLREVQRSHLSGPEFRWEGVEEPANFILANEVADALPVHRAMVRGGHLHELLVGPDLTWVVADHPHPALDAYFADLHVAPQEGSVVDVCLDLPQFVASISHRLE